MKVRSRVLRWSGLAVGLIVVGAQFVPVARTNPPVEFALEAPGEVDAILRRACYNCHSHETRWPWYGYVAPASWFVIRHVNRGRGDLNFSAWPILDFEAEEHAMRDIEKQIDKGKMPLRSYTLIHRDARLTAADRDILLRWARTIDNAN